MNSTKNETLKSTSSTPPFSPELLREIFLFLALDTANQRRNICAVSLVCTQWAHVAYSTKELWTAMHHILHEDEEMSEDSPASRFLSNLEFVTGMARGLPLEINWVADHELEDWWQPFINTALQRIAEKVSDLTLDLHRIGIIRAIQQKRRGQGYPSIASWPELKKLKLRSQDTTGTILNSFQATTGNMPLLVDLSLINISVEELAPFSPPGFPRVQPMFPWPQLVRLQLSQPDLIVDIALVLYRCRALEECSFCVKLVRGQQIPTAHVVLPKLRRLAISASLGVLDGRLLDLLVLPALEFLSLRQMGRGVLEPKPVLDMINRSECTLKELCLSDVEMSEDHYLRLLRKLPTLEDLTVVHYNQDKVWLKFIRQFSKKGSCGYLPVLKRVQIGLGPVDPGRRAWTEIETWFSRMIEVRTRTPVCHPTAEDCRCSRLEWWVLRDSRLRAKGNWGRQ